LLGEETERRKWRSEGMGRERRSRASSWLILARREAHMRWKSMTPATGASPGGWEKTIKDVVFQNP
jgi:hypothetical protein